MIKQCRSCKSSRLVDILSLGDQYLSDFIREHDPKPEKHPLNLIMCQDCDLVQLRHSAPPSLMYNNNYGYRSGINETMRNHLKGIVEEAVKRVDLKPVDIVVDIGSNDATLLKNYPDNVVKVGFDPVEKFGEYYNRPNLQHINNYFSADEYTKHFSKKAKIITAISMFYDLEDPSSFVRDLVSILDPDGILIIQQNYLLGMIQQNAFDNICHEHLEYYSLTSLTRLLNRYGLDVVDAEMNDLNGGSFRVYVKHMNTVKKMRIMEQKMKLNNRSTYLLFAMKVQSLARKINKFIKDVNEKGKSVYIYGASTRGNTLIQACKLDNTLIKAAVERNPEKFGKFYSGTNIPIISEEQARAEKPDYMLVLPWFFKAEFIKRESEYLKKGGHLIFPLPHFEVV